jgi:hypothetical protein
LASFRQHYDPKVGSASNRNEYQEYLLGGKGGRCIGLKLYHLHVPTVLNAGSLNLLESLRFILFLNLWFSEVIQHYLIKKVYNDVSEQLDSFIRKTQVSPGAMWVRYDRGDLCKRAESFSETLENAYAGFTLKQTSKVLSFIYVKTPSAIKASLIQFISELIWREEQTVWSSNNCRTVV